MVFHQPMLVIVNVIINKMDIKKLTPYLPYKLKGQVRWEQLFELHYDVFGLIESREAVDINKIKI